MQLFASLVRRARRRPARTRPTLECLEGRWVPATVTELSTVLTDGSAPTGITAASDGSIWFTERSANQLGRVASDGTLTEYSVPTASSAPEQITASPDGNVWFTERYGRKIGRVSQGGGGITEFTVPGTGAYPTAITTDGSGKVWFASADSAATARLGRISSTGTITQMATGATRTTITSIVGGPDGNLWVTEVSSYWGDSVSKVTTSGFGSFTNYRLPTSNASPQSITVGSDNNLWFTESSGDKIGQITTDGALTEYALPAGSRPQQIVSGPDGALWFTEKGTNQIASMATDGTLTEYALATDGSQPFGIAASSDGSTLWFTEQSGNQLGQVTF
jgi:virginiamycin B lyase